MPRPAAASATRSPVTASAVWYVRVGHGPRIRIRAEFGTPEFDVSIALLCRHLLPAKRRHRSAPCHGCLPATVRQPLGLRFRGHTAATRNIFAGVIETAGHEPTLGSPRRPSSPERIAAQQRRTKRAISSTPCAACSVGRTRRNWSRLIPPLACIIRAQGATASFPGPRITSPSIRLAGLSGPGSAHGSTFCSTRAYAVAMPCDLVVSMSAMAWHD